MKCDKIMKFISHVVNLKNSKCLIHDGLGVREIVGDRKRTPGEVGLEKQVSLGAGFVISEGLNFNGEFP